MPQSIIQQIRIIDLFGKFSYNIPEISSLNSPAILYGDNGSGKSTILNLTFHALSAAGDKGHRSALRKIPFKSFTVILSDGHEISAKRKAEIDAPVLDLTIHRAGVLIAEWSYSADRYNRYVESDWDNIPRSFLDSYTNFPIRISSVEQTQFPMILHSPDQSENLKKGEGAFLKALQESAPIIFYLNADRRLDGDNVVDSGDEAEIRSIFGRRDFKNATDILRASRNFSLKQALENAAKWVANRAIIGANLGSENTHSTYESVLDKLANDYATEQSVVDPTYKKNLMKAIEKIEKDTRNLSKYELFAHLKMDKFLEALSSKNKEAVAISAKLIEPYIAGLSKRIEATKSLYDILDRFVTTINDFLSGKSLSYNLSRGFTISDESGNKLEASQLSSGEQQLVLMFAYVLSARDRPSVFIIDEPEISLNIKWQRKIIRSLLSVAEKSTIQFIFASHSLELISQHSDAVVEIGRA